MMLEQALERLRRDVLAMNEPDFPVEYIERFQFIALGGHVHVEFYGDWGGKAYTRFATEIAREPIASAVASIRIGGPDKGANGTRHFDLTPLAEAAAEFTNLRHLLIEQNEPADHNRTILGGRRDYDEEGVLAEIARRAPRLTDLTTPSAPNSEFFKLSLPNLTNLNVDAGFDTQNFILNLSRSSRLPQLRCLQWGEYCETYMEGWGEHCTPFWHYRDLFRSDAFRSVKSFVFKNPACTAAELAELKSLRPDLQMLVVRWSHEYVRAQRSP